MKLFRKGVVTAAALLAGAVGLSNVASAALQFDVQVDASTSTGTGFTVVDSHHVNITATGGTLSFNVWAISTGSDANISNDFFLFGRGNVIAAGPGPMGDMNQGAMASDLGYQGVYGTGSFNFAQSGYTNGANVDLNGNGFKDLGALDGNSGDATTATGGAINSRGVSAPFWLGTKPNPPRALFYTFTLPITSLGGGDTTVIYNNTSTGNQIQWKEDNVAKSLDVGVLGTILSPLGVTLSSPVVNVPEPASLGVLALGGLALLARRRKTA